MALGLTQPLTEISTRDVWMSPGGKDSRCVGLKVLQPSGADCLEILGASDCWNPQVLSRPVVGLLYMHRFTYTCTPATLSPSRLTCLS